MPLHPSICRGAGFCDPYQLPGRVAEEEEAFAIDTERSMPNSLRPVALAEEGARSPDAPPPINVGAVSCDLRAPFADPAAEAGDMGVLA